jgi:hypothetical protein
LIGRGPAGAELGGEAAEGGSTVVSTADAGAATLADVSALA